MCNHTLNINIKYLNALLYLLQGFQSSLKGALKVAGSIV